MKKGWIIAAAAALVAIVTVIILLIANPQNQDPKPTEIPTTPNPTGMVGNFLEPDWD